MTPGFAAPKKLNSGKKVKTIQTPKNKNKKLH